MSDAVFGTAVESKTANLQTLTSLGLTRATTTTGEWNLYIVGGFAAGNHVAMGFTLPGSLGDYLAVQVEHTTPSGNPSPSMIAFARQVQSGDTNPTINWTGPGQAIADVLPITNVDPASPFPYVLVVDKSVSNTTYAISGTTGSDSVTLITGSINKSGAGYTGQADTIDLNDFLGSATGMTVQHAAASVAGSSAWSRSFTGPSTSVGITWAIGVKGATGSAATATGSITLSGSAGWTAPTSAAGLTLAGTASPAAVAGAAGLLSLTGAAVGPGAAAAGALTLTATAAAGAPATASGALTLAGSAAGSAPAGAAGSITLAGAQSTPVQQYINRPPMMVAHRFGDVDWVELTRDALNKAAAWNRSLALNADGWETSDGVWVASHDQNTSRVFGTSMDIPTSTWAALSGLTTTVGGFPIEKVADLLALYPTRIWFIENKAGATHNTSFFSMLAAAAGPNYYVIKAYYTQSSTAATAHGAGYKTWGYYFDADSPNIASTQASWDLLGMDYTATSGSWAAATAVGKPVLGHVVPDAAGAATAFGFGATGIMASGVREIVTNDSAAVTGGLSLSGTASGKAPASAAGGLGLAGSAAARAPAAASGALTFTATVTAGTRVTAVTGSVTLAGVATVGAGSTPVTVTGSDRPLAMVTGTDRSTATVTST